MVTVSVSAYNDADLLENALASVRSVLGNVEIQVVDGKYDTFRPDADPNSTDDTKAVTASFGADYYAEGPFPRERHKHIRRVELAPADEWLLLMDADERLHAFDRDALPEDKAVHPRIVNAVVYGPKSVYWPRLMKPGHVNSINRWDAYLFDVPTERLDAVTLIHRHDLRSRDYRKEKYRRFDREDRQGFYAERFETYLSDDWAPDLYDCPECGARSVTRTQATPYGPALTYVETCLEGDGCHTAVRAVDVGEWRYLPDRLGAGFAEAPRRLRRELVDAGCAFVAPHDVTTMVERLRPSVELWVESEFGERESEVFA